MRTVTGLTHAPEQHGVDMKEIAGQLAEVHQDFLHADSAEHPGEHRTGALLSSRDQLFVTRSRAMDLALRIQVKRTIAVRIVPEFLR